MQKEILHFVLHCIYLTALVTFQMLILNTKYDQLIQYYLLLRINHLYKVNLQFSACMRN